MDAPVGSSRHRAPVQGPASIAATTDMRLSQQPSLGREHGRIQGLVRWRGLGIGSASRLRGERRRIEAGGTHLPPWGCGGSPRWPIGSRPSAVDRPLTFRWRSKSRTGRSSRVSWTGGSRSTRSTRSSSTGFRDRFSPAGAKDDSLDARVLADALRTDLHHFRRIDPVDPVVIELRAWSRIFEELTRDRTRLSNRVRDQLWRYYPQMLEAVGKRWSSPGSSTSGPRLRHPRRPGGSSAGRWRAFSSATGSGGSRPTNSSKSFAPRPLPLRPEPPRPRWLTSRAPPNALRLVQRQLADAKREIARLIDALDDSEESSSDQIGGQRDVTVLSSLPGVGQTVLATLLAEAPQALARRDYKALRCLTGVAPVTRQSGKYKLVMRRVAAHARLRDAVYHWARVAVPARPRQQGQVRRPSRARPRPRPCLAFGRGPPARGRLRHAPNPDLLPASTPGGESCGLISSSGADQQGSPRPRGRYGQLRRRPPSGSWLPTC